jgi:mono/diheme cytochrome c family protein
MRRHCAALLAILVAISSPGFAEDASPPKENAEMNAEQPYTVKDGTQVDEQTLAGWRTWRGLACERCHGAEQEGLVGPSLVESLKVMSKEDFHTTVMEGRIEKGMPPFNGSQMMQKNWEGLYAYLKGRSDGKIEPGRLTALPKE